MAHWERHAVAEPVYEPAGRLRWRRQSRASRRRWPRGGAGGRPPDCPPGWGLTGAEPLVAGDADSELPGRPGGVRRGSRRGPLRWRGPGPFEPEFRRAGDRDGGAGSRCAHLLVSVLEWDDFEGGRCPKLGNDPANAGESGLGLVLRTVCRSVNLVGAEPVQADVTLRILGTYRANAFSARHRRSHLTVKTIEPASNTCSGPEPYPEQRAGEARSGGSVKRALWGISRHEHATARRQPAQSPTDASWIARARFGKQAGAPPVPPRSSTSDRGSWSKKVSRARYYADLGLDVALDVWVCGTPNCARFSTATGTSSIGSVG